MTINAALRKFEQTSDAEFVIYGKNDRYAYYISNDGDATEVVGGEIYDADAPTDLASYIEELNPDNVRVELHVGEENFIEVVLPRK